MIFVVLRSSDWKINYSFSLSSTMEEESNGELAFLATLLKHNGEISVLVYRKHY